jgi:hypothetical protein
MIAARHGPPDLRQDAACALAQCDQDGTIRAANPRLATWCGTCVRVTLPAVPSSP